MWESIKKTKEYRKQLEKCVVEELEIQAVVGASGFGAGKAGREKLWKASTELTAWKDKQSGEIHYGEIRLSTPADDRLLKYLQQSVKGDSVIRCRVHPSKDGKFLLMAGPVQAGKDPELEAVLQEQTKEVTMEVEGLGTFTLDRTIDWFETRVDWLGNEITLSFDQEEEAIMEQAAETARTLMADQKAWDQRIRECAADELLESANEWAENSDEDGEDESGENSSLISREQFMERMELESVQTGEGGEFDFWFWDGDMFWGHSIHVAGNVEDGPDWAGIEG